MDYDKEHRYRATINRFIDKVPGYSYFKQDIEFGNPTITLIDFPERGYGRLRESLRWHPHISPSDLHHQLAANSESISTRYILIQDLTPQLCLRLGAIFDIDPQFFLDHVNNQVNGLVADDRDKRMEWNVWGLDKSYFSFHWYRPVRRSSRLPNAAYKRKQIERQDRMTVENRTTSDLYQRIRVTIVRSESNILRSELDLSVVSMAELAAVEERVSVYQIERDGCRYGEFVYVVVIETNLQVIMLLDRIPRIFEAKWDDYEVWHSRPYIPPSDAEISITDLYECLVPRFEVGFDRENIQRLNEDALGNLYSNVYSTMDCITGSSQSIRMTVGPEQSHRHFPLLHLFDIVISDTLGLLRLLDDVQSSIVHSVASPNAHLEDLLAQKTLITTLQSQLPALDRQLQHALDNLIDYIPHPNQAQAGKRLDTLLDTFQTTIHELKEASNAIAGTLQFIESHRAILEAESVTRLTELAFLFIPLSFAASLFSMQIEQLETPVPVKFFVAFALSLSALTYFLRLLVRSSCAQRYKHAIWSSVRERSAIPPGAPIPTGAFMAWFVARVCPLLAVVVFLACVIVPPLAVIWIRELDPGLRIGLTVVFVFLFAGLVWPVRMASDRLIRNGIEIRWYNAGEGVDRKETKPFAERIARWMANVH